MTKRSSTCLDETKEEPAEARLGRVYDRIVECIKTVNKVDDLDMLLTSKSEWTKKALEKYLKIPKLWLVHDQDLDSLFPFSVSIIKVTEDGHDSTIYFNESQLSILDFLLVHLFVEMDEFVYGDEILHTLAQKHTPKTTSPCPISSHMQFSTHGHVTIHYQAFR